MAVRAVIPDQDNLVTDWLPVVQPFSGAAGMPSVDDSVLCAFIDSGLETGFCLGKVNGT
jgi:phage baseplate assembly protein gpV